MVSDLSVVVISLSVIVLCWAIVRLNQKLDEATRNTSRPNDLSAWSENAHDSDRAAGNKSTAPFV